MEAAILSGSIRPGRQSHRLACYLQAQMITKGWSVSLIDLKNHALPVFGSDLPDQARLHVEDITARLKAAHAVVFVTPEYLSNIPAALKNVLEYCGSTLTAKVAGIASASASKFGGLHASNSLQLTLLNLGAYLAPRRLLAPEIHLAFNEDGTPRQDELREQAGKFIETLSAYTRLIHNEMLPHEVK
ncbi:NADPH-dependent FMN reductase [Taibaiella koreensis]|uniref:NADPH-dependent FMN reductase n=1 Tax=Taibaiella koreensis TaxID=1268548 RepID=UPI000E5A0540|nr:NAD(P)H-dependent oxidoreductase [Taibaiella koreensis]